MANAYELGTSPHPPNASPSSGSKFGVFILVVAAIAAGAWYYIDPMNSGEDTSAPAASAAAPAPATPSAATETTKPATSPTPTASPAPSRAPRPREAVPAAPATITPVAVASPSPSIEPVKPTPPSPAPVLSTSISLPPAPEPDLRIYDMATADVTPPSLLTPIGIAPVRTNYVPGPATIEIIVGGDGSVQSVKAGKAPVTVGEALEMMNWLSTAKSWRFGPAVRNSQPVKYRLVVPLSALVSGRGIR